LALLILSTGFEKDAIMTTHSRQPIRWVALLRAVNVGGRKVPMAELRALAEDLGFTEVSSFIASGNLLLTAAESRRTVAKVLQDGLAERFGFTVEVLLRSQEELVELLADNPFPKGAPNRVMVGFLDGAAPAGLEAKLSEVATAHEPLVVDGEHLWIHFDDGMAASKLANRLPSLVKPRWVTVRNVRTVQKLADLLATPR
jgi:uncharacterized protein (DUF1697 family)